MNDKKEILKLISDDFGIYRGKHESEIDYKCRLVYSMAGYMGYSALWDDSDTDDGTVSINHFKSRIEDSLEAYQALFPELNGRFSSEISDEIYNVFVASGYIYHSNYRIRPCIEKEVNTEGIILCRGRIPEGNMRVSGLGSYYFSNRECESKDDIRDFFSIDVTTLKEYYHLLMKNTSFSDTPEMPFEYLRTQGPFTNGYWIEKPDTDGVTIARSGRKGSYLYYLIEADSKTMYQLPGWMTENGEYRTISNCILLEKGTLPESRYVVDDGIVHLSIGYLFPNKEMNIIKLYGWPSDYLDKSNDFKRVFSYDVFIKIKDLFESIGYKFAEEK